MKSSYMQSEREKDILNTCKPDVLKMKVMCKNELFVFIHKNYITQKKLEYKLIKFYEKGKICVLILFI